MPSDETLVSLRKRRSSIQGSCTRVKTFVDSIKAVSPSIAQVEERKTKLEQFWSDFETVQSQIEAFDESEMGFRQGFEDAFYLLMARMREIINPPLPTRSSTSPSQSFSGSHHASDLHVRLPKINLPTFTGKYEEWCPFSHTFNAIIHSNTSLSDIQKFQYLRASLSGDASNIVNSLEMSALNYEIAWGLLKDRYDNKRAIVHSHIKAIMDLPTLSRENAVELRRVADGVARHMQALHALKRPTDHWDDLIIHILCSKLDPVTAREWQSSLTTQELPTFKQFLDFISHYCQMLEATGKTSVTHSKDTTTRSQTNAKRQSSCSATVKPKCGFCNGEHLIYRCKDFIALTVAQRNSEIRKRKTCINCLRATDHRANDCPSGNCKLCKAKHNTLLHAPASATGSSVNKENDRAESTSAEAPAAVVAYSSNTRADKGVILSTAVVYAYDVKGTHISCRALLDSGSQANFISRKCLGNLQLKTQALNVSVSGISGSAVQASQIVQVRLQSRVNSFSATIDCIVTNQITDRLPTFTMNKSEFALPRNIQLADPQFHVSSEIDLLVGADLFWQLLCIGQIKATSTHPTLQKTRLGWVLAGRLSSVSGPTKSVQSFHTRVTNKQLDEQLLKFWQFENVRENSNHYTTEESTCEQHFLQNVTRNSEGRYIVKLPFREDTRLKIGDSKDIALKRLRGLEKRFNRDPDLKVQYSRFINEYITLGHMVQINDDSNDNSQSCYLPHHGVFKGSGHHTKIRVVFDASSKTSSNISLNDALFVGPVIQQELICILIRFRTFRYVVVADIIKMYRQVLIHPSDTRYQRILWREDPTNDVKTYELQTVTYGTSSASFLATRSLDHLAEQAFKEFPVASIIVRRDFYMDDLLTGSDTIESANIIRDEVIALLRSAGFELSKWASNVPDLVKDFSDRENDAVRIDGGTDSSILGVRWDQSSDLFFFTYQASDLGNSVTKRVILAEVSRLFDPLGLLGPVIVIAKLILQDLWQSGVQWDESVPQDINSRWIKFKSQLPDINRISIPRCVKHFTDSRFVQLHGFCDASQNAYGACVYIRTKYSDTEFRSELLCSKSRIAPLKTISLARLELCAALLLSQLIDKIREALDLSDVQIYLWSDATITLGWIASSSRKFHVFVANRVGEIQRLTQIKDWRHVSSSNNPADILSRGLEPCALTNSELWWHGPDFLAINEDQWPNSGYESKECDLPERKVVASVTSIQQACPTSNLLEHFSNLSKICRILAYCLRFFKTNRPEIPSDVITVQEMRSAMKVLCKSVQQCNFAKDHKALAQGNPVEKNSNLRALAPFLHTDGLIRVEGRLKESDLDFEACHPIVLPRNHTLSKRVIEREHIRVGHGGVQATMAAVRQRY